MKNKKLISVASFMLGFMVCGYSSSAVAAPKLYDINFNDPLISGSFTYNTSAPLFSNFYIDVSFSGQAYSNEQWLWTIEGRVGPDPGLAYYTKDVRYDLTGWANDSSLFSDSCDWCTSSPLDTFQLLTTEVISWSFNTFFNHAPFNNIISINSTQGLAILVNPSYSVTNYSSINTVDSDFNGSTSRNGVSQISPVPEPETYAMLLAGLGLLSFTARRRKQSA